MLDNRNSDKLGNTPPKKKNRSRGKLVIVEKYIPEYANGTARNECETDCTWYVLAVLSVNNH